MHFRRNFYPLTVKILNEVNRDFQFNFLTDTSYANNNLLEYFRQNAKFNYRIIVFHKGDNYRDKIRWSYDNLGDNDYFCKHDEDIFLGAPLYEYLIDNASVVDDNRIFLAPWLMNGVPTADESAEYWLDSNSLSKYQSMCLATEFDKTGCGACIGCSEEYHEGYLSLNGATIKSKSWNYHEFYRLCWNIKHHWRGINPSRINFKVTELLNDFVIDNMEAFKKPNYYNIYDTFEYPYFCNSIYITNKNNLGRILDRTLKMMDFDEVPLNLIRLEQKLPMTFVGNSMGVHTLYGNAKNNPLDNKYTNTNGDEWELDYYKRFLEKYDRKS